MTCSTHSLPGLTCSRRHRNRAGKLRCAPSLGSQFDALATLVEDDLLGMNDNGTGNFLCGVFRSVDGRESVHWRDGQKGAIQGGGYVSAITRDRVMYCHQEYAGDKISESHRC